MNEKTKKILGIASFISFIFIFITAFVFAVGSLKFGQKFQMFVQRLEEKFSDRGTTFLKQSVVEEDSAIVDVVEKASPSVVSIVMESLVFDPFTGPSSSEEGVGTGFIVDSTGIIVTNSHVIDNGGEYRVVLSDGTTYEVKEVHTDNTNDLSILEIDARGLPALELGDSDKIKVGQKAIAIGNALGQYSNTVTAGVVSGIARQITAGGYGTVQKTYEDVIQTDAAVNPGNSGGPLLNLSGQVIGINVATSLGADNISFAIPSNTLRPVLQSYFDNGRIIKPFLGVSYSIITEDISKLREFPEGAFVSQVYPNTPAEKAGLKRGDIIVGIDDESINVKNSLSKIITRKKVGDLIEVFVDRDGEKLSFIVTLEEIPEETR